MEADLALRNSARRLLRADLALVREDLADKGVGARAASRLTDAALDLLDDAIEGASANSGKIAGGVALAAVAGGLWVAREPILAAINDAVASIEDR
jgi:hypothetical protein